MNQDLFIREVVAWQRQTFPQATVNSVLSHLREEVQELMIDPSPEEAADVLMLLVAFADKAGFDLMEAARAKLDINTRRQWTIMAPGGYTKHG